MKTQKPEEQADKTEKVQAETENQIEDQPRKTAFMITPIGSDVSDVRRAAEGVIDAVILPVLEKHNIDLTIPHRIDDIGNITNQVINLIVEADLVIANLTTLNANVMYELAIRHAKRLPVIIIAEVGTKLPFDVTTERTFFYTNDMAGVKKLFEQLDKTVPKALLDKNPGNPIYNAISDNLIKELVNKDKDPVQSYMLDKLEQLSESVSSIRNSVLYRSPSIKTSWLKNLPNEATVVSPSKSRYYEYIVFITSPNANKDHIRQLLITLWPSLIGFSFEEGLYTIVRFALPHDDSEDIINDLFKAAGYEVERVGGPKALNK